MTGKSFCDRLVSHHGLAGTPVNVGRHETPMITTSKAKAHAGPPLSLRERQREERAALILQAAYDVLVERGYYEVSMDEIAARVGISKGTLYLHFASKEALVARLLEQEIAGYLALIDKVAGERLTVRARLERILGEAYVSIHDRHQFLLILRSMDWNKSAVWDRLEKQIPLAALKERLTKLFEEGQRSGELDPTIDTPIMVSLFLSLMRLYTDEQLEQASPHSPATFANTVSRALFQGLLAPTPAAG